MTAKSIFPASRQSAISHHKSSIFSPAGIIFVLLCVLITGMIFAAGGDPLDLAQIGTRFSLGDAQGTEGYDGQFVYYIAANPRPQAVAARLDVPAYRYQRILLPLLARVLAFGSLPAIPWALALLGILSHTAGVWAVGRLLAGWGVSRWYALAYGLFAGFLLAVRLDLPEPLAFGLVALALLADRNGRYGWSLLFFALAPFAKEVAILFVGAQLLADLLARRWQRVLALGLATVLPYLLFQLWLWRIFGQPGLGSGGAMATPFEIIPFMGLLRIGFVSPLYLLAMLVVFGPFVVLPSVWGAWKSLKTWVSGDGNVIVLALFVNAVAVALLPYSTYRETGGLLRLACGLVLSLLLFAGRYKIGRVLNYSFLWIVLNVFLFK